MAAIKRHRPDLLQHIHVSPEEAPPETMPSGFLKNKTTQIEDIGEPCTAYMLTQQFVDPTNWYAPSNSNFASSFFLIYPRWLFEKYDGIRAFWNPLRKTFYSRYGNKLVNIPQEVVDAMPETTFLDGEFWYLHKHPPSLSSYWKSSPFQGLGGILFKKHWRFPAERDRKRLTGPGLNM